MKKIDIPIIEASSGELPTFISEENKHLFPEDMQFAFDYIQSHPIVFPDSYLRSQKKRLKRKINQLFKEQPDLAPKKVLFTLLEPLPDFIPADMMAQLCVYIMGCWQEERKAMEEQIISKNKSQISAKYIR